MHDTRVWYGMELESRCIMLVPGKPRMGHDSGGSALPREFVRF